MDQQIRDRTIHPSIDAPKQKGRTSRGRGVLTTLIVLLLLAGIVWWTRHQSAPQQAAGGRNSAPMSIVPETVAKGDIGVSLNALGTVTSLATVTIRSQISGYLMKVDFKEGDEVKRGDLIAEIDSRPYEATLAQAKGQLARDEAQLKGAQVDLARYQNLAAQNAVPHQQLDTQVALVAQYQGTVEADRASVKSAEVNLQYCRIVSPINGRVGLRQVDLGNYVTPGDTSGIVVITQLEPISVLFTLPEDNLQAVAKRLRDGAVLPTAAYDRSGANKLAEGTLQTFDSQIDPTTGTIKLRAKFENDQRTLYPNQFVNVRLLLDTHKDVTTMSTAGIQRGVPGTFVYLVNGDSTVSVRPVKLGVTAGDRVEVLSGLSPGDRVVIDGADKLREGAKVIVRSAADVANPAAAAKGGAKGHNKGDGKEGAKGADPDKAGGGKREHSEDGQKQ
ncbi:MdtA/MuxA family multidrug efflux RND transporter periplasmic adaptor subunit [Bradyrhizobium sp. ISRA443]|uniref:MdtA/MuxA family multidrug efflux RND transporter periplasmic adaptor subunit n=1 Tax=unclassified Bradyrhizobium TaxID=2631580 RepID=UPI00247971E5|nr:MULTISPECIES: MdtA/MuxA family multidrug efflux RND transporter periplasmic adaptor subunit [unclassified Bradyrhizobium]WGR96624.1 MdtA/MuxA family multidrug efflux RND transporter periplasmic adaptor subunit [Bradyrhizobium sp. ISRA436]WGS03511.1 MdtA/MuxA family multidrug efflux RND transporter periplasmic adaptor subunit [Bradyrhizobium sp. ISRA437]WGS10395.1 MdtA/MuxA family multidrug efflux RND transporter periplasmic adaptor subunit [Bradyrhizobium sp. ISRA443]